MGFECIEKVIEWNSLEQNISCIYYSENFAVFIAHVSFFYKTNVSFFNYSEN